MKIANKHCRPLSSRRTWHGLRQRTEATNRRNGILVQPGETRGYKMVRKATHGAHAGWIYARAAYETPLIGPFTHVTSLASYVLKSTGGSLRRVAISTVQMPLSTA